MPGCSISTFAMTATCPARTPVRSAGGACRCPRRFHPSTTGRSRDAIVHLTYTAASDDLLRLRVEDANADLEGTLRNRFSTEPLLHVFSMRHDFSRVVQRLLHQPAGTQTRFTIGRERFPLFSRGLDLEATSARVALVTSSGQGIDGVRLAADGEALSGFALDPTLGDLPAEVASGFVPSLLGDHRLTVVSAGALAPTAPTAGDLSAIDERKLEDILIAVRYRIASEPVPLARAPLSTAVVHYRRPAADYADLGPTRVGRRGRRGGGHGLGDAPPARPRRRPRGGLRDPSRRRHGRAALRRPPRGRERRHPRPGA